MDKKINARKKAQRLARQRKMRNRRIALTICLMIAVSLVSIGGTLAWITAKTDPLVNTFTVGDINIDLYEHLRNTDGTLKTGATEITREGIDDYKFIPGTTLHKDPTAVVKADSEKCILFVKVEKTGWNNEDISYSIDADWNELTEGSGIYYQIVEADDEDQSFNILTNKQVTVSDKLTKAEVDAITSDWTLSFTAYACQYENMTGADDAAKAASAWAILTAA